MSKAADRSLAIVVGASMGSVVGEKITRAIDRYSHQLAREYKLTGPQVVCLRQLHSVEQATRGRY